MTIERRRLSVTDKLAIMVRQSEMACVMNKKNTPPIHITHGMSNSVEYRAWINMKSRCLTPSSSGFEHYGGRGIAISSEWISSFETFLRDMGTRPSSRHSIDRIDVNGPYSKDNCRWATKSEQLRNTRNTSYVNVGGVNTPIADAAEAAGIKRNTVLYRKRRGCRHELILSPPQRGRKMK